jgi:hypothetical protein
MRTILPLGAFLALSLAGCSSSATGPNDLEATMDPGRAENPGRVEPETSCSDQNGNGGHSATMTSVRRSGRLSLWYSSSAVGVVTECSRRGRPV